MSRKDTPNLAQLVELLTVVVFLPLISKGSWFDSSSSENDSYQIFF